MTHIEIIMWAHQRILRRKGLEYSPTASEIQKEIDNLSNGSESEEALHRITRQYLALHEEFAQYRRESIKWSVEDFLYYDHPTHTITPEQAQVALEHMIDNHDANIGITWETISGYIMTHGVFKDTVKK